MHRLYTLTGVFGKILKRGLHETKQWECDSNTLDMSSWFWYVTRSDSQARHKTFWLGHQGPLKKWELTRRDTSVQGYRRASKARRVFPSTFSLSRCLGFFQRECTASIRKFYSNFENIFEIFWNGLFQEIFKEVREKILDWSWKKYWEIMVKQQSFF